LSALSRAPVLAIEPKTWARMEASLSKLSAEDMKAAYDLMGTDSGERSSTVPCQISGTTALVTLNGIVSRTGPDFWDMLFGEVGFSTLDLEAVCKSICANPGIKTVVMDWNSPGGTVEGTARCADMVASLKQNGKRVISYASELMASAAYWIGSQADEIYVGPTADVGSIGVFQVVPDTSKMYEDNGIKMNVVKSAPGKALGMSGTPVTQEALNEFQAGVDEIHKLFVEAVGRGRNMRAKYQRNSSSTKPVPDDGRCYMGQAAVDCGLADGIKSLDQIMAELSQSTRPAMGLMSAKGKQGEKKTMNSLAKKLGLAEDATEEQIAEAFDAKLAGVTTINEQVDARVKELTAAAIAKFEREQRADSLLRTFSAKVTGAQEESARKLIAADPDAFESFMSNMPVVVPTAGAGTKITVTGKVEATETDDGVIDLGDADDRLKLHNAAKVIQSANASLSYEAALVQASAGKKLTRNGVPVSA